MPRILLPELAIKNKKNQQPCKRDSVSALTRNSVIYPGCTSRCSSNGLPLTVFFGPRLFKIAGELPGRISAGRCLPATAGNRDVHGLSTHKVYPGMMSPPSRVSSYLTFSPLSASWWTVIFCGTCCSSRRSERTFPLGSMMPCVVPTFLSA